MRQQHKYRLAVVIAWSVFFCATVSSQEQTPLRPLEPSDTSSPAATLTSLVDACNELDKLIKEGALSEEREAEILPTTERILDCVDLSELPKELRNTAGIESALFLKEVLDRIELPALAAIPKPATEVSIGYTIRRGRLAPIDG